MVSARLRLARERVTLRLVYEALSAKHAPGLFLALADPRVWEHIEGGSLPATVAALAERFTRVASGAPAGRTGEQWVNYAVALADEPGIPIGRIEATIHAAADGCWAETAYLFNPAHWGHGFASEALTWLHAELEARGVHELWVAIAPGNARSLALARRLGYLPTRAEEVRPLASYDPGDVCLRRVI